MGQLIGIGIKNQKNLSTFRNRNGHQKIFCENFDYKKILNLFMYLPFYIYEVYTSL